MKKIYILIMIVGLSFSSVWGQEEISENARRDLGQVKKTNAVKNVLGVKKFDFKSTEGQGKGISKFGIDAANQLFLTKQNRTEISSFFKGFMGNTTTMRLAEINDDRLNTLSEEFTAAELEDLDNAKKSGRWVGIDYFVDGYLTVNPENGATMVYATALSTDDKSELKAAAAPVGYDISNVMIAKMLADNLEEVYNTPAAGRDLVFQIQEQEQYLRTASPDRKVLLGLLAVSGFTGGALAFTNPGFFGKIMGVVGFLYGGASGYGYLGYSKISKNAEKRRKELMEEYNKKYGERYVVD